MTAAHCTYCADVMAADPGATIAHHSPVNGCTIARPHGDCILARYASRRDIPPVGAERAPMVRTDPGEPSLVPAGRAAAVIRAREDRRGRCPQPYCKREEHGGADGGEHRY